MIPAIAPQSQAIQQLHSAHYFNPQQLPEGGVLVIGAGSSGVQIADELQRAGRAVWLSVERTTARRVAIVSAILLVARGAGNVGCRGQCAG
nr:Uncharacterized oxidoreductase CzcO [Klebsiella pneumoniae]